MSRKIRVQYSGAIYHVMSRGDRQENIFLDDVDRQDFIKTLAEACQKTGFQVHAYCLMSNHFHLVVETPNANLVDGMRWLLSTYTIRLNHRHKLFGHVFSGRYKALIVDGSGTGYLRTVCDYVHLNPSRARLLGTEERLLSYPWSSLVCYLSAPTHRPAWMRTDRLLGEHAIRQDNAAISRVRVSDFRKGFFQIYAHAMGVALPCAHGFCKRVRTPQSRVMKAQGRAWACGGRSQALAAGWFTETTGWKRRDHISRSERIVPGN